ncbi:hypothetical protein [Sphingobium sp. HWE2-09]|uniref:hypothetical protein n=1 Tax=Sphingobium sp. HWE2-09 TaxID=3108390 RepID=UPI002DC4904F|nr:hypothetical protein [Sphingobium sp. HWE2-09]
MIQCELSDGKFLFVNMDRVVSVSSQKNGDITFGYLRHNDEITWVAIKRFQIIKPGTWY